MELRISEAPDPLQNPYQDEWMVGWWLDGWMEGWMDFEDIMEGTEHGVVPYESESMFLRKVLWTVLPNLDFFLAGIASNLPARPRASRVPWGIWTPSLRTTWNLQLAHTVLSRSTLPPVMEPPWSCQPTCPSTPRALRLARRGAVSFFLFLLLLLLSERCNSCTFERLKAGALLHATLSFSFSLAAILGSLHS